MSHESAALIGGLRQAVDDMLVRMATDPTLATQPSPHDSSILQAAYTLTSSKLTPPSIPEQPPGGWVSLQLLSQLSMLSYCSIFSLTLTPLLSSSLSLPPPLPPHSPPHPAFPARGSYPRYRPRGNFPSYRGGRPPSYPPRGGYYQPRGPPRGGFRGYSRGYSRRPPY